MMDGASQEKPGLAESPWFWISLFCMGALLALILMQSKYAWRQPELERQYQARQESGHSVTGRLEVVDRHAQGQTVVSLRPLTIAASLGLLVSWMMWLRQRLQVRASSPQ